MVGGRKGCGGRIQERVTCRTADQRAVRSAKEEPMKSKVRRDCLLKGIETFLVMVTALLLISLGVELLVLQHLDEVGFAGIILVLFTTSWIAAFGIASVALIPVWLLVRAKISCQPGSAFSQAAESRIELMKRAS